MTGFSYNNHSPFELVTADWIRYMRQGHVVAFMKWILGYQPNILNALWFVITNLLPAFAYKGQFNSLHLAFIRLEFIGNTNGLTRLTRAIFRWKVKKLFNGKYARAIYEGYYWHNTSKGHPFHEFAKIFDEVIK